MNANCGGTNPDRRAAYAQRLLDATSGAFDLATAYLGIRLDLYRSLHDDGPATSAELADRTGTDERMAREWLEQQAATEVLDATRDGDTWRFALPAEHAAVLLDPDALDGMAGTVRQVVAELVMVPRLVEAFQTGQGIPYADYGPDESEGQTMSTRPVYRAEVASWFAAVPDLHARLERGAARVLDIGCGIGWSSVSIANAFPAAMVDGIDRDPASIEAARAVAEREDVSDRVSFEVADAAELAGAGYDVATMFEMLHDLPRPVESLASARAALAPDGVVLVAEEITAEEFDPPSETRERRYYGWSLLSCLPMSMAQPGSVATGTVIRPATVRRYAEEAGFAGTELLPVDSDAFRLYLLRP